MNLLEELRAEFGDGMSEEELKTFTLQQLRKSPAYTDHVHPEHKAAMQVHKELFGIDSDSLKVFKDQPQMKISDANQASIEKLMKHPAFLDRDDPQHKSVMRKFNRLHIKTEPV